MYFKEISYDSVNSSFIKLKERATIMPSSEFVHVLSAYKRVLAEDIISKFGVPRYNSSHMDGFAVRYTDIKSISKTKTATLRICNIQVPLKEIVDFVLPRSHAYRISTGISLPKGSDTVIPLENTKIVKSDNYDMIEIKHSIQKGSFVYPASMDIRKGEQVLLKGTVLRAQDIGLLTLMRIYQVPVFKKPTVALIPTGNELSDSLENTGSDKIPNIHGHIISWLVKEIGGTAIDLGVTPDELTTIQNKIEGAITRADLILTIGGSSVGKYDLVKEAIKSRDARSIIAFRTKLDRGRVTGLAALNGKPIIILPGPIQGAINAFIVFAYPLLRLMSGRSEKRSELTICATLIDNWEARRKFPYFTKIVYVKLFKRANNKFVARPLVGETESMSLLTKCNGYIIVPQHITNMRKGQNVEVNLMPGFSY